MPDSLNQVVWNEGDALCVWVASPSWKRELAEHVTRGVLACAVVTTLVTLGFGIALWLLWIPMLLVLWLWVRWRPTQHRIARVGRGSVRLDGLFAPRVRTSPGSPVVIDGNVGRPIRIGVDGVLLVDADITTDSPWTLDTLTWFAQAVATQLGRPIDDRRPMQAWRDWERDPLERAAVQFDILRADNAEEYPQLYAQPARPLSMDMDHHGARIQVFKGNLMMSPVSISLTNTTLSCGEHSLELTDIVRVGWVARDRTDMSAEADSLELHVLTKTRWIRLFHIVSHDDTPWYAARLTWLQTEIADRVMDARRRARMQQGRGSSADVPTELANLMGAVRAVAER